MQPITDLGVTYIIYDTLTNKTLELESFAAFGDLKLVSHLSNDS